MAKKVNKSVDKKSTNSSRNQNIKLVQKTAKKPVKNVKKVKKSNKNMILNKNWLYGSMVALMCMLILFSLFVMITYIPSSNIQMKRFQSELVSLRSAMNTDSVRQDIMKKIIKIINKFNPKLSSEDKYDIASEIYEMSIKYTNLDVDLLCAMITHESANTWNPDVVSPAGAMGLMQIMPVTGMFLAKYEGINWSSPEEILFNPVYNIRLGSRFLSSLILRYELDGALAAYNGGERQAAIWLANGRNNKYLWEETKGYIPAVQELYKHYLKLGM